MFCLVFNEIKMHIFFFFSIHTFLLRKAIYRQWAIFLGELEASEAHLSQNTRSAPPCTAARVAYFLIAHLQGPPQPQHFNRRFQASVKPPRWARRARLEDKFLSRKALCPRRDSRMCFSSTGGFLVGSGHLPGPPPKNGCIETKKNGSTHSAFLLYLPSSWVCERWGLLVMHTVELWFMRQDAFEQFPGVKCS